MTDVRYSIERTRNRHSRAVLRDGVILVRLARGLPYAEEQRHIDSLVRRMAKAHGKEAKKVRIDPFGPLFGGEQSVNIQLLTGSVVNIQVQAGKRTTAMRVAGGWSVLRGSTTDDRTFLRFLWKLLAASATEETDALVQSINTETFGGRIKTVTLKYMRSRWGSCSQTGIIALATPLLLTTPEILRYVIIHELGHIKHHDHSRAFWAQVAIYSPDYARTRKLLLGYSLP